MVPAPHATEFRGRATAKESRKHHPDDCAHELWLAAQAPCDLGHHGLRQAQVLQGVVQGLGGPWRLAPIALKTFMGLKATALSGFGLLFGVSFEGGHGVLLQTVLLAMHG